MGIGARDDVNEIGALALQHLGGVMIGARDSEAFGEIFGAPRGRVSHRHYLRAFDAPPGFSLEPREASGADHYAFQKFKAHTRVSSSFRRSLRSMVVSGMAMGILALKRRERQAYKRLL